MKNFLIALVAGFFPALTGINEANAQPQGDHGMPGFQNNGIEIREMMTPVNSPMSPEKEVNPKALKSFAKIYKHVSGESWIKTEDGYSAKFNSNGTRNLVFFTENGKWFGSLKGYSEEKLPYQIRDVVKSKYYDYSIYYVEEVETVDSNRIPTYIIHLEGKDDLRLIRIRNGEMDEWKAYVKK